MQDLGAGPLWINGVVMSSCSVNRATTFLIKIFWQNNHMNIKIEGKLLEFMHIYQQSLFWKGVTHVSPSCAHVYD